MIGIAGVTGKWALMWLILSINRGSSIHLAKAQSEQPVYASAENS